MNSILSNDAPILWQQVILVKACSLREINNVCQELGTQMSFHVRFSSSSVFGFWHLFQALSEQIGTDALMERALSAACPHLVVGRKRKQSGVVESLFWSFGIPLFAKRARLNGIPVLISVDENLARDSPISPFWARQTLCSVETKAVSLIALNAYVSTLGGGHYLCKHVEDAWNMALRQQTIAIALGDPELAGQCRIHLAYISMQVGKLKSAQRRLQREREFAHKIESGRLLAVVNAAEIYLKRLMTRTKELRQKAHDKVRDGFYRQRFVDLTNRRARII